MNYEKMWQELKEYISPRTEAHPVMKTVFNKMTELESENKRQYSTAENPYKNAPKAAATDKESR